MAVTVYRVTNELSFSVNDQNGNCAVIVDSPAAIDVRVVVDGQTIERRLAAGTYTNNIPGAKSTFRLNRRNQSVPVFGIWTWSVGA